MLAAANNCTSFWMRKPPLWTVCSVSTQNVCKQMSHYLVPSVVHVHSLHFNFCLKTGVQASREVIGMELVFRVAGRTLSEDHQRTAVLHVAVLCSPAVGAWYLSALLCHTGKIWGLLAHVGVT